MFKVIIGRERGEQRNTENGKHKHKYIIIIIDSNIQCNQLYGTEVSPPMLTFEIYVLYRLYQGDDTGRKSLVGKNIYLRALN